MDEYESGNVGLEAGLLPDDLKGFGVIRSKEDFWGALIGVIGASMFIGFLLGQLYR